MGLTLTMDSSLRGGAAGGQKSTVASASGRAGAPFSVGASGSLNVTSARVYDFSAVDNYAPELEYANWWVNAAIVGAAQEVAIGTDVKLKLSVLTGVNATQANTSQGYNQSGATLTSCPWSLLAADSTGSTLRMMKLDDTVQPPTFTAKTFAQFQADGGSLSGNTLTVPSGYHVRCDPLSGVKLSARTAYAVQQEEDRPPQQLASAAVMVGSTVTVTVPSTARWRTGNKLALIGFTPTSYNTVVSTPVPITVVDATTITLQLVNPVTVSIANPANVNDPSHNCAANDAVILTWTGTPPTGLTSGGTVYVKTVVDANNYTVSATPGGAAIATSGSQSGLVTRTKTGLGPVTGFGNIQASKPLLVRAQSTVASNAFGDIQITQATTPAVSNTSTNWSSVSTATTVDGVGTIYVARISGTSYAGKKPIGLYGDSIGQGVGDNNQANPSGSFIKGDQYGSLGAFKRAMNIAGYSYFCSAVPSTLVGTVATYGGNLARQFVCRGVYAILSEDVHNQAFAAATSTDLINAEKAFWATVRAATPTSTRLIAVTPSPTTAQVSASQWNARTAGAQSQSGAFIYPTGLAYGYLTYLLGALNPANGDPDAVIDFAQLVSNALTGATVAIDGYWPADGTAFWGTGDGTHGTFNVYAAVAPPMAALLPAAFGFAA